MLISKKYTLQLTYENQLVDNSKIYIIDNESNLKIVTSLLGKSRLRIVDSVPRTYIEIDLIGLSWRTCLSFEFLYTNAPDLYDTNKLISLIRERRIEDLIK